MQSDFVKRVNELLLKKTGKTAEELDYRDLPEDKSKYNTTILDDMGRNIGNARIKTKKEAEEEIENFLKMKLK